MSGRFNDRRDTVDRLADCDELVSPALSAYYIGLSLSVTFSAEFESRLRAERMKRGEFNAALFFALLSRSSVAP